MTPCGEIMSMRADLKLTRVNHSWSHGTFGSAGRAGWMKVASSPKAVNISIEPSLVALTTSAGTAQLVVDAGSTALRPIRRFTSAGVRSSIWMNVAGRSADDHMMMLAVSSPTRSGAITPREYPVARAGAVQLRSMAPEGSTPVEV